MSTATPTIETTGRRGRPSDITDAVRVTISLSPDQVAWLNEQDADSRSQAVRRAIDALRDTDSPAPAPAVDIDLDRANRQLQHADAQTILRWAIETFGDRLVLSTSFGAQAAVMLHLATQAKPDIPVVWIDTGYLFKETYEFARQLTDRLKLNLKVYQSPVSPARMEALNGLLWEGDLPQMNTYDFLRKVEPMQRALKELNAAAWLSGVRAQQTDERQGLHPVECQWDICKVHPILSWSSTDVHDYLSRHDLPYHPLVAQGYRSIGDWHSTRSVTAGEPERAGRFRGLKSECGLHMPQTEEERLSRDSSGL
jgi:phosphoadenosine phosphosulfate reductase